MFGYEADKLCTEHQLIVDAATRTRLIRQIADAVRLAEQRTARLLEGDFSPDANLTRFPVLREMACSIAGHKPARDAHSVYEHISLEDMKSEIARFPVYM